MIRARPPTGQKARWLLPRTLQRPLPERHQRADSASEQGRNREFLLTRPSATECSAGATRGDSRRSAGLPRPAGRDTGSRALNRRATDRQLGSTPAGVTQYEEATCWAAPGVHHELADLRRQTSERALQYRLAQRPFDIGIRQTAVRQFPQGCAAAAGCATGATGDTNFRAAGFVRAELQPGSVERQDRQLGRRAAGANCELERHIRAQAMQPPRRGIVGRIDAIMTQSLRRLNRRQPSRAALVQQPELAANGLLSVPDDFPDCLSKYPAAFVAPPGRSCPDGCAPGHAGLLDH